MFKTIKLTELWYKYLGNRVDGINTKGKLVDPLGIQHNIVDVRIDEDDSGELRAVLGHYLLGEIQCCFYAVPLSTMVCKRGRIVEEGYIKSLELYWFKVSEYELPSMMNKGKVTPKGKERLYWASANKHLAKNIEMYGVLGDALINEGYYSSVEQEQWILDFEGRVEFDSEGEEITREAQRYSVHRVLMRTKKQRHEDLDEQLGALSKNKDCGGFILEVHKIQEGVINPKLELLFLEYPTEKIRVPRWELIHDAGTQVSYLSGDTMPSDHGRQAG